MVRKHSILTLLCLALLLSQPFFISISIGKDTASNVPTAFGNNIRIEGEQALNSTNGVSSGNGTLSNPYIIENKTIDCGLSNGIHIANTTSYILIRNCTIYNSSFDINLYGIFLDNADNVKIDTCNINSTRMGILSQNSRNTWINDTVVTNCRYTGIATGQSTDQYVSNCTIMRNQIHNIQFYESTRCYCWNSTVGFNNSGIQPYSSNYGRIWNNTVINSGQCISITNSPNFVIDSNTILSGSNTNQGIAVFSSANTVISNNTIYAEDVGILGGGPNTVISSNIIKGSSYRGIFSGESNSKNIIVNNTVYDSSNAGILISAGPYISNNSLINCSFELDNNEIDIDNFEIFENNEIDSIPIEVIRNQNTAITDISQNASQVFIIECNDINISDKNIRTGGFLALNIGNLSLDNVSMKDSDRIIHGRWMKDIRINNSRFEDVSSGLWIVYCNSVNITNTSYNSVQQPLKIYNSDNINFSDNFLNGSGTVYTGEGICENNHFLNGSGSDGITSSDGSIITNNTIHGYTNGIRSFGTGLISNNTIVNNSAYGIRTSYTINYDTIIQDNTILGNGIAGILLDHERNIEIRNNTVNNNGKYGIHGWIEVFYASINNNTCIGNGLDGIYLEQSMYRVKVRNNSCFENNRSGIYLDQVWDNAIVEGNNCSMNYGDGIYSKNWSPKIQSNIAMNNSISGIYLDRSGFPSMNILKNNPIGMRINISSGSIISNSFLDNQIGLVFTNTSSSIKIYDNYFDNDKNYDPVNSSGMIWYGEPSQGPNIVGGPMIGGNYWSDYNGTDTNHDGFGDQAHGSGDIYPLFKIPQIISITENIPDFLLTGERAFYNFTIIHQNLNEMMDYSFDISFRNMKGRSIGRYQFGDSWNKEEENISFEVLTPVDAVKALHTLKISDEYRHHLTSAGTREVLDSISPTITSVDISDLRTGAIAHINVDFDENILYNNSHLKAVFMDDNNSIERIL